MQCMLQEQLWRCMQNIFRFPQLCYLEDIFIFTIWLIYKIKSPVQRQHLLFYKSTLHCENQSAGPDTKQITVRCLSKPLRGPSSSKALEFNKWSCVQSKALLASWPHVSGQLQLMKGVMLHYKSTHGKLHDIVGGNKCITHFVMQRFYPSDIHLAVNDFSYTTPGIELWTAHSKRKTYKMASNHPKYSRNAFDHMNKY